MSEQDTAGNWFTLFLAFRGQPSAFRNSLADGLLNQLCTDLIMRAGDVARARTRWLVRLEPAPIALGYGSLYNHSFSPNAEYVKIWEEQLIRFIAFRDIAVGEEITVNYNGTPGDRSPIWFEVSE